MVLLILLLPLICLLVLYSIRWVCLSEENGGSPSRPTWLQAVFRSDAKPLVWFLKEYVFGFIYVVLYGVGWGIHIRDRLFPGPLSLNPDSDRDSVILVHGLLSNAGPLLPLKFRLSLSGWSNVFLYPYSTSHGRFQDHVDGLTDFVLHVHDRLPDRKVHLVGHSLGALIAYSVLQKIESKGVCGRLIALGAPFRGTKLAHLALSDLGRRLVPGHAFLSQFQHPTVESEVVSIRSDFDALILPGQSADCPAERGETVQVEGVGHMGFCFSNRVADLIKSRL